MPKTRRENFISSASSEERNASAHYYTYCIYFWHRRTKYYLLLFSAHVSLLKEENFAIEHEVGEDAVSYLHMKVSNLALKGVTVTS